MRGIISLRAVLAFSLAVAILGLAAGTASAAITWGVAGSGAWDTITSNWTGDSTTFTDNGAVDVIFNNTAGGTITIAADMSPLSTTVSAASGTYTFSGGPIDSGTLVKSGGGTLVLSGANTYTGATTVNAGTLKLDFSAASAPTTDIISGSSALVLGGGTLNLTGKASTTNSQAVNGTTINPGLSAITLTANATANPLSLNLGAITRSAGSVLRITQPTGPLSGSNGVLTASGSAGETLLSNGVAYATIGNSGWAGMDATNTWIAPVTYTAATATSLSGNASFDAPNVSVRTTTLSSNTTITSLRKTTQDTTTLTINAGITLTTGGILISDAVGDRSFTINGSGSLRGPAGQDLVFLNYPNWEGAPVTISVPIVDNGSATAFTYSGNNAPMTLTGSNTYTGTTTILAGNLSIGAGGTTGSLDPSSQIVNNGSLTINRSDNLTFSNSISGTGTLTKSGAGTLTLSGTNTYAGATTINAGGKLLVSGDQSLATGAVAVASGATLGGGGIIGGAVTVVAGGHLAPGTSLGTLTVGTPSVNKNVGVAGGVWDIEINGGTGQADKLYVNGNLTWSGTQTLNFTAGSPPGTYTFAEWTGTGTSPVGTWVVPATNTENHWIGGTDLLWDTKTNWNPDSVQSGSVALNGNTLQLTVSQDDAPASVSSIYIDPDADVVVSGPASDGKLTVKNLTIGKGTGVNTAALVLQSGGNLTVTGATTVRSGGTLTATAAGLISPILNVNGGTVLLSGANGAIASSTGITIGPAAGTTGTLTLDNSSANNSDRVSSVAMTMNNGTLNFIGNATTASTETIGTITAAVGHNQLVLSGGDPAQVAILTSTAGAVTRAAGATLNILADGTSQQFKFTGGAAGINKGVFLGTSAAAANEFAYYPGSGAALVAPTYDGSGNFATPATTLTASKHNKLSGDDASEGAISIYSLNMPSNYSLTALTGNLTFTSAADQGAIIKSGGGAAQIGTAGDAFDIVGQASGELVINTVDSGDNLTLNVGISNGAATPAVVTSALTKTGAGTLTLTANRDYLYTGATYVNAGTLVLNSAAAGGFRSSVTINNGGTAKLGASNKIIDIAAFTVNAGGTFDLAGFSERIGALNGSGSVANTGGAATLTLQASSTFSGVISGNTALTLTNIGPFVLSGQNTYSGATTVTGDAGGGPTNIKLGVNNALPSGGILNLGTFAWFVNLDLAGYDQTVGPLTTGGQNGSVATVYNSVGASKLTLSGGATAVTTQSNYHTGQTFIAVTTLDLNNAAQTFNVADTISVNDLTISSVIQNGALTKTGAGTMLLSGASTYAGGTRIDAGTLALSHATNTLADAGAVNVNGGTLSIAANSDTVGAVTLTSGSITGSSGVLTGTSYAVQSGSVTAILAGTGAAMTKTTSGTVTLSGANTYTGATTINAGTLALDASGSFDNSPIITVGDAGSIGAVLNVTAKTGFAIGAAQTLKGIGTVNAGAGKTLTINGTLAPGNSIGTLNVTGDTTLAGINDFEISKNVDVFPADELITSGSLAYGGILKITSVGPDAVNTFAVGNTWDLFGFAPDSYTGTFTNNADLGTAGGGSTNLPQLNAGLKWSFAYDTGVLSVVTGIVPGDTNDDGVVDAADYITVKQNFGMTEGATWAMGNFSDGIDGVGTVDWDDLQILMGIFATRSVGGAPAIPEPATLGLLMFGAAALLRRRKA